MVSGRKFRASSGTVLTEGGSFALVGFNGFVGRENELAEALAGILNATDHMAFPPRLPEPDKCAKCGGHDFSERPGFMGGGIVCNDCEPWPPEEDE